MDRRFLLMLVFLCVLLNSGITEASMRKTSKIKGIIAPVPTPYKNNTKEIAVERIYYMAKDLAEKGVDGVLITGYAGEGPSLSEAACKVQIREWTRVAGSFGLTVSVMIGDPTDVGIRLAIYAEEWKVDAIFMFPPLFYKTTNSEAELAAIRLVTDHVKHTPVILNVNPSFQSECVSLQKLYYLLTKYVPVFSGISCGLETALEIRAAGLFKPRNQYLIINHQYATEAAFSLRFNASVAETNFLVPKLAVDVKNAYTQQQRCACADAVNKQDKINEVFTASAVDSDNYVSNNKAAYEIITCIKMGGVRAPLQRTTCDDKRRITQNLRRLGIHLNCPVDSCNPDKQ